MADCIERAFQIASKNDTANSRRNIREHVSPVSVLQRN